MRHPITITAALAAGLLALTACGDSSSGSAPSTSASSSLTETSASSATPTTSSTPVAEPSPSQTSASASGGWSHPDALPAAEGEGLGSVQVPGLEDGLVDLRVDAVEYTQPAELDGTTVAAVAVTATVLGDQPVELGSPMTDEGWMWAATEDGAGAQTLYQMGMDYSEPWSGRDVAVWHSGPFQPGQPEQMLLTFPVEQAGGYLVYGTPNTTSAPIQIPADDTGLPNAQITRAHEIVDSLGWGDGLLTR